MVYSMKTNNYQQQLSCVRVVALYTMLGMVCAKCRRRGFSKFSTDWKKWHYLTKITWPAKFHSHRASGRFSAARQTWGSGKTFFCEVSHARAQPHITLWVTHKIHQLTRLGARICLLRVWQIFHISGELSSNCRSRINGINRLFQLKRFLKRLGFGKTYPHA